MRNGATPTVTIFLAAIIGHKTNGLLTEHAFSKCLLTV